MGLPQGDIELKMLDSQNRPVGSDSEREVCVHESSVMAGYTSNLPAHESAFTVDGSFCTSDNAKIDGNAYLFFTGRPLSQGQDGLLIENWDPNL